MQKNSVKRKSKKFQFRFQSQDEVQETIQKIKSSDIGLDWTPSSSEPIKFSSLSVSSKTVKGLTEGGFLETTDVQSRVLPHALVGRDVLVSARTGSGKTLSFVIPLLERLFIDKWSQSDGIGGLVIAPTRELAMQIFEVLRIVGKYHNFSAGLVTGGKNDFAREQTEIGNINILVSTPGRLLQHLEQSANFNIQTLRILILDEADLLLDMGFQHQINRIIEYLPPPVSHTEGQVPRSGRQSLLFSATINKHVNGLIQMFLPVSSTVMVGINEESMNSVRGIVSTLSNRNSVSESISDMPTALTQLYTTCALPDKLLTLYSFIKSHIKSKMIVFISTAAQVKYFASLLSSLTPGVPILGLHGKNKQTKRTTVYFEFERLDFACLLATDVASRGLDFPNVDWVIQFDAPESCELYIHRVGRTARFKSEGKSLLLLTQEQEDGFVNLLTDGGIRGIKSVQINQNMLLGSSHSSSRVFKNGRPQLTLTEQATSLAASDPAIKLLAVKAFKSYVRSIVLMPNQNVIVVRDLIDMLGV